MEADKLRKKLKFQAVILILAGFAGFIASIFYWFILGGFSGKFSHVTNDEHAQVVISWLLIALKALGFGAIPIFGILMVRTGWNILAFLRKKE